LERRHAELLGVTLQLTGESWLNAKPFQYCGSIGPIRLPSEVNETLQRMGDVLRSSCGLRGLFGVDFILSDNAPWPVEVNPRYTASIEVLEYATGIKSLEWHRAAFEDVAVPAHGSASRTVGKAILFAPKRIEVESQFLQHAADPIRRPSLADIPNRGELVESGWPILSILTEGDSLEGCRAELQQRAREMSERIVDRQP
jgi:predicted ATP-grasp superfamily ATP-dependent carboligase